MMPCLPRSLWGKEKPTTSKIHHNMWQWVWGLCLYGFQATFCSCEKRTFLVLSDHIILYHCNYLSNYKGFVHDWQQSLSFLAAPQKPCGGWHFCWLSDTKTQLTSLTSECPWTFFHQSNHYPDNVFSRHTSTSRLILDISFYFDIYLYFKYCIGCMQLSVIWFFFVRF